MSYYYVDASRESEEHALPDVEVFYMTASDFINSDEDSWMHERMADDRDCDADSLAGYFYAYGFPGCLWDSDPAGPFDTALQAFESAREDAGYCPHGVLEAEVCEECPAPELWVLEADPRWYAAATGGGRTSDPTKAMAWVSKTAAEKSRDRMAFCDGTRAVRLPDDEARKWGRCDE